MYLLLIQIYEYGKYNFHGRVRYLTINLRFTGVHVHKTSPKTIYTLSLLVIYWLRFWMKTVHSTVYQLHLAKAFFCCFWMLQRSNYHVMFKYIKCKLTLNYSKIYILPSLLIWNYKFLRRPNSAVVLSPSGKPCTVSTEVYFIMQWSRLNLSVTCFIVYFYLQKNIILYIIQHMISKKSYKHKNIF